MHSWEQRKLGDITTKIGSGKTPKGGAAAYKDDGIALIRSQNVNGDRVDLSDVVFIDEQTDEDMKNSRVLKGDVLLNITGASIGRSAVFTRELRANVNQHVCIIRTKGSDASPEFIQLNIISSNGQNQIDSFQAGGGREGLNFHQIGKMEFLYPGIEEQQKIGQYFANLDHLITLHQRKCDEIKTLKKYMLQKMFSQNGEKVPEIRFNGFTEDWEQRKLGEVLKLENGYAFKSQFFSDNETNIIVATPGNVSVDGGFIEEGGKYYKIDGEIPDAYIFHPGDLFVTMTDLTPTANTLGKPATVPDNGVMYLHNQRLGKLIGFEGDKAFLYSLLCTSEYHNYMVVTASGSTVRHSSPGRILEYEIAIPGLDEQIKIGKYFSNLDHLITLHQRKCNELKEIKKYMLQNMFV